MSSTDGMPGATKYERLANVVRELIKRGALRSGMRAPSLREIARQQGVSLSTAMQAYQLLEERGELEARPRSGFFVTSSATSRLGHPFRSRPPPTARKASLAPGTHILVEQSADARLVPLGCAIPSATVLGASRLDRHLARLARQSGAEYNTYTVARGDLRLREMIVRRAAHQGHLLTDDDVIVTSGCTEALGLALGALTVPGDTVAIESPTYFGLLAILEARGLKVLELPTDPRQGVDVKALDAALSDGSVSVCLFASNCQNPLGFSMEDEAKRTVLDVLRQHRVPLIEDDVYGDIHFGSRRPRSFSALDPGADITYCSSFSKTLAPGYRVGWVASPRRQERLLAQKMASSLSGSALAQAALGAFLASGCYESHLRRLRASLAAQVDQMLRAVEATFPDGTRVSRPQGGFVLWVQLPAGGNARTLYEQALDEGICIAPGELFTVGRRYKDCLRLSCGHEWNGRIERAIETLGQLAATLD